jgi:class 3 adenylate cyclase
MDQLPSGTVTFLFTDIEDSTRLWQEQPEAMSLAHALHDKILHEAIEAMFFRLLENHSAWHFITHKMH